MNRRQYLSSGITMLATVAAGCSGDVDEKGTSTATEEPKTESTTTDVTTNSTADTTTEESDGDGETVERVVVGPGGELVFDPEILRIEPGTTVTFVWESDLHNVVVTDQPTEADWSGSPGDRTETYDTGYEFSYTFEVGGTYEYQCAPHLSVGMEGNIEVVPVREPYTSETDIDTVDDDWPRFSATSRNTGHRPTTAPERFVPAWRHELEEKTTQYPPVVADGRLYTWTANRLLALDAASGTIDWSIENEDPGWSGNCGPTVVDGVLYTGQTDGVTAFDATTGDERWRTELGEFVASAPTVSDDSLFFTTSEDTGAVHSLDRATGEPRWRYEFDEIAVCTPATDGSTVYVGSWDETFYALDADTGSVRWEFEFDDGCTSAPVVVDGGVYAVSWDGNAYRINADTGEVEWVYDVGRGSADSPIVADGAVVGTSDADDESGAVWKLDAETGTEQWRVETTDAGHVASATADGLVFVSIDDAVVAFDVATGRKRHEHALGISIGDPVVADGVVFVGGEEIHALAAE